MRPHQNAIVDSRQTKDSICILHLLPLVSEQFIVLAQSINQLDAFRLEHGPDLSSVAVSPVFLSYIGGGTNPAITINGDIAGPVIIDLKGFTLTSDVPTEFKPCVSISGSTGLYPITIRNGTITMFEQGVFDSGVPNVTVNNVNFNQDVVGVDFRFVTGSTVNNCHFTVVGSNIGGAAPYGISDYQTPGGNSYNNNTFVGIFSPLYVVSVFNSTTPLMLDRCQFAPPPTP
jgi:hypothetical protein